VIDVLSGKPVCLYFNLRRNTNMTINKSTLSVALGGVLVASMAASPVAGAAQSPFAMASLDKGYMVAAADTAKDGKDTKMKDGKCGEGKCGGDKAKTGKPAADKAKMKDGKCGEGKCGGTKK
jgi:uncharacterized low-complexity protein